MADIETLKERTNLRISFETSALPRQRLLKSERTMLTNAAEGASVVHKLPSKWSTRLLKLGVTKY